MGKNGGKAGKEFSSLWPHWEEQEIQQPKICLGFCRGGTEAGGRKQASSKSFDQAVVWLIFVSGLILQDPAGTRADG
jgi:hypothetical protein